MKHNQLNNVLIDAAVRRVAKLGKAIKIFDGAGLYLRVSPYQDNRGAAALWRFDFRWKRETQTLSFGRYPGVTIAMARERRDAARKLVDAGIDPRRHREEMLAAEEAAEGNTFGVIWQELFDLGSPGWAEKHAEKVKQRYEKRLKPKLADVPLTDLENDADLIESVLRPIWEQDPPAIDTAWRVLADISAVFRRAMTTKNSKDKKGPYRATRDPTRELLAQKLIPKKPDDKHFAAIRKPQQLGELLRAIDGYTGRGVSSVSVALRLLPHIFLRPGELRNLTWDEIEDLDGPEPLIRIPGEKMKMGNEHLVPLSKQAATILKEWRPYSGERLVFPSLTHGGRVISDGSLGAALRRIGFDNTVHVPHGFRGTASTMLNEMNFHPDLIELQLAHREKDKVRGAYNRSLRLDDRRKMMQTWSDRLDALQSATNVVSLRRKA